MQNTHSTMSLLNKLRAIAPATELGTDLEETFNTSISKTSNYFYRCSGIVKYYYKALLQNNQYQILKKYR